MKKVCSKCKDEKELKEFNKNKSCPDGFQAQCKKCKKEGNNIYVEKNYSKYIEYHKKRNEEKYFLINSFKKECYKCKESRYWVLDFHHLEPQNKTKEVSSLISSSKENIINEIKKCITLCRNCHSDFHFLEKQNNITIQDYINNAP